MSSLPRAKPRPAPWMLCWGVWTLSSWPRGSQDGRKGRGVWSARVYISENSLWLHGKEDGLEKAIIYTSTCWETLREADRLWNCGGLNEHRGHQAGDTKNYPRAVTEIKSENREEARRHGSPGPEAGLTLGKRSGIFSTMTGEKEKNNHVERMKKEHAKAMWRSGGSERQVVKNED